MTEFSLGNWHEEGVGVFDGFSGKLVARIVNADYPNQPHLPQDLLDCIRFGARRLAALRQCRAGLTELLDAGVIDAVYAACEALDQVLRTEDR